MEQPRSGAAGERVHAQVQLVDQAVSEHGSHECDASAHVEVADLVLQAADPVGIVGSDDFGVPPRRVARITPAPIDGDPRLAERLVINLVDNAMRHNVTNGRVELTTGSSDGSSYVSVANTGPRIPPDDVDRLFEPFRRLSANPTPNTDGVGLGLAIVRAIANAHDANIAIAANNDGGLHIAISFPRARGDATAPDHSAQRSTPVPAAVSNILQ